MSEEKEKTFQVRLEKLEQRIKELEQKQEMDRSRIIEQSERLRTQTNQIVDFAIRLSDMEQNQKR